jgi:hypothetical protein
MSGKRKERGDNRRLFCAMHLASALGQFYKIFQKLQADALAFFRVKLRGENIIAPDGGRKRRAVIRAGGDDGLVHRLRVKTMDEVHVTAARDSSIQRAFWIGNFNLIPTDLRDFQAGFFCETHNAPLKNPQPGGAGIEFLTFLKQSLVADANAQERTAGLDKFTRRFQQFLFAQRIDAVIESPDAGQHKATGIADLFGMLHQADLRADFEQRFVDAAQIAGAIIE